AGSRWSAPRAARRPGPAAGPRSRRPGPGPGGQARSARPAATRPGSTPAVLDQGADLGTAGVEQAVGQGVAQPLGVVGGPAEALADQPLAVQGGKEAGGFPRTGGGGGGGGPG